VTRSTDAGDAGGAAGRLGDDHDLSWRARAYGEAVVCGDEWPLEALDLSLIEWATSTRAKRRNGWCRYDADGGCTVTVGEHVRAGGGFEACRETIRHELVHVWQHQHADEFAAIGDGPPAVVDERTAATDRPDGTAGTVRIEPGHGPSFRAWVGPLDLAGRCSSPYDRERRDYAYVFECPDCGDWWGRHRLCKRVRQAAHGDEGPAGYCYCVDCESLVHLRADDRYLEHGDHDDETIRAFAGADGRPADVTAPTVRPDRLVAAPRPASDD
jgi:hypothetical protein